MKIPDEYRHINDRTWELTKEYHEKSDELLKQAEELKAEYAARVVALATMCANKGHIWEFSRNYQEPAEYRCVVCHTEVSRDTDRPTYVRFQDRYYEVVNPNLNPKFRKG